MAQAINESSDSLHVPPTGCTHPDVGKNATPATAEAFVASSGFLGTSERVVTQVCNDARVVRGGRDHLVAFPPGKGHGANSQRIRCLRLPEPELSSAAAEMTSYCRGRLGDWDAAYGEGRAGGADNVNDPVVKMQ
jgi:hypothetical protein